jgi:hypothetical protein
MLGSVAALFAVSGAYAADAVVAPEPEPANYVKVCDAYGSGFYYIPGTQTCFSINGYVWWQFGANSDQADGTDTPGYYGYDHRGWESRTRVRVNLDARTETELGTLRGWIRFQSDFAGSKDGDGPVGIDQAWVQLGGFVAGYGESSWFYQFNNSTLNYGTFSWGGLYYSYQERSSVKYEFGGKQGIYGVISLEDPADEVSYVPDVVGRIGYSAGWGAVAVTGAYDHNYGADFEGSSGAGAFVVKGEALFNLPGNPGTMFKLAAGYASADSNYGADNPLVGYSDGTTTFGHAQWYALASLQYQVNPNLALIASGEYMGNLYAAGTDHTTSENAWAAEVSAVWLPVKDFEIRPEIVYTKADHLDGTVSGFLRFTRYF